MQFNIKYFRIIYAILNYTVKLTVYQNHSVLSFISQNVIRYRKHMSEYYCLFLGCVVYCTFPIFPVVCTTHQRCHSARSKGWNHVLYLPRYRKIKRLTGMAYRHMVKCASYINYHIINNYYTCANFQTCNDYYNVFLHSNYIN